MDFLLAVIPGGFFYIRFFWENGQQTWLANFLAKPGCVKVAQLHGYSKMSFPDIMTVKIEELGVFMDEQEWFRLHKKSQFTQVRLFRSSVNAMTIGWSQNLCTTRCSICLWVPVEYSKVGFTNSCLTYRDNMHGIFLFVAENINRLKLFDI